MQILECTKCGAKTKVGVKYIRKLSCNCGGYKTTIQDTIQNFLANPIGRNKERLADMIGCDLQGQPT